MTPLLALSALVAPPARLTDKTLVVWASPANLTQRGGSALTLEDGAARFDGVVFGELSPGRWMPGSNGFARTLKEQDAWPVETADSRTFVQLAVVYRGQEVTVYRDGHEYARYTAANPPQSFGPAALVLFGRRHLDATDREHSFAGRLRDARIYAEPLTGAQLAALAPGRADAERAPWAWWSFADEGLREKTGRFTEFKLLGDVRLADGCLVLGGGGATVIARADGGDGGEGVSLPRTWPAGAPVPPEVVRSTRVLRERLLADPYRPAWHFCLPEDLGQPGDPNGAFFAHGRYHLMYLYKRSGGGFCWGHVSSGDLVHWRHHPDALGPGEGDDGCFSGGAFVDDDGTAWLSYWMLWGAKGIGLASSSGPLFEQWRKSPANPVIRSTEWGVTQVDGACYGSADPSNIWKHNGRYYLLTGNLLVLNKLGRAADSPPGEQGDRLYLLESDDLRAWRYRHVFYQRRPEWTDRSEDNMCPSFLPLPASPAGGPPSGKHLLLFISHNKGCQYYVGDYRDDHFYPDHHGRLTWVDNTYFAPEALVDDRGRQIMWSWLLDNRAHEEERGWSGVYGLPRSLWLGDDGTLRLAPVEELAMLRRHELGWRDLALTDGATRPLAGVVGDSCELDLAFDVGTAARCGLKVRASAGGEEETLLYYDVARHELVYDSTRSGQGGRQVVERAPLELAAGEPLRLRVFVDKSVVEVFANERQAIGRRVYPVRPDSLGVRLFATGGTAVCRRAVAWELLPANPY